MILCFLKRKAMKKQKLTDTILTGFPTLFNLKVLQHHRCLFVSFILIFHHQDAYHKANRSSLSCFTNSSHTNILFLVIIIKRLQTVQDTA
ncbi:unnamed protein product [Lactuca virosa]|uniref:Uncharacterized protein n=1 Tax=Lactuca virosa TaxID=75947 RepID=A0AAU9MAR4_9ASTR|nr:unnamed protein product [Lactuca virosa]